MRYLSKHYADPGNSLGPPATCKARCNLLAQPLQRKSAPAGERVCLTQRHHGTSGPGLFQRRLWRPGRVARLDALRRVRRPPCPRRPPLADLAARAAPLSAAPSAIWSSASRRSATVRWSASAGWRLTEWSSAPPAGLIGMLIGEEVNFALVGRIGRTEGALPLLAAMLARGPGLAFPRRGGRRQRRDRGPVAGQAQLWHHRRSDRRFHRRSAVRRALSRGHRTRGRRVVGCPGRSDRPGHPRGMHRSAVGPGARRFSAGLGTACCAVGRKDASIRWSNRITCSAATNGPTLPCSATCASRSGTRSFSARTIVSCWSTTTRRRNRRKSTARLVPYSHDLNDGDRIQLGGIVLRFQLARPKPPRKKFNRLRPNRPRAADKRGQVSLPERPEGCCAQRYLTPFVSGS